MTDETTTPEVTDNVAPTESSTVEATETSSWIPEDLKDNPSLAKFKDPASLAKSYVHLEKMQGNALHIPSQDASEEELTKFKEKLKSIDGIILAPTDEDSMKDFRSKIGVPETHDAYQYNGDLIKDLDDEAVSKFNQVVHDLGLTNDQAEKLLSRELEVLTSSSKEREQKSEATVKSLKEKWGSDFETKMSNAKSALAQLEKDYPEAIQELEESGAITNSALLTVLSEVGTSMNETSNNGNIGATATALTPETASAKISELHQDPEFMGAYLAATHPDHSDAVEKMNKLLSAATQMNQG